MANIVLHKRVYEKVPNYSSSDYELPSYFKGKTSEISINVDKIVAIEDNCVYTDFHKFDDLIETKEEIVNILNKYLQTYVLELKDNLY